MESRVIGRIVWGGGVSLSGGRDGVSLRSEVRDKKESDWEGNE